MIRTLNGGLGITVNGGSNSPPFFNMNSYSGTSITPGTVRYNGQNYNFEVYDGYTWLTFPSNYTMVELSSETSEIIEWVKAKKAEENYIKEKYKENKVIQNLLKQRNDIDEKVQMVIAILQEEVKI